ncbi:hypothetical protein MGAST_02080 [Mycobacterium gastri 'Wayne']|nr:hypothetical protein MGAST_02080 [Mycobacterium gastri 'Wayne']
MIGAGYDASRYDSPGARSTIDPLVADFTTDPVRA